MGVRLALHLFTTALLAVPAYAAVTSTRAPAVVGECRVIGGERLPKGLDRKTVCTALKQALSRAGVRPPYVIDVEIKSSSRMAAWLVLNGRALPRQNVAVSDDELTLASVQQLADALAAATK